MKGKTANALLRSCELAYMSNLLLQNLQIIAIHLRYWNTGLLVHALQGSNFIFHYNGTAFPAVLSKSALAFIITEIGIVATRKSNTRYPININR